MSALTQVKLFRNHELSLRHRRAFRCDVRGLWGIAYMIRNSITPTVAALLKAMSPGQFTMIERCRSLEWKARSLSGRRIEIDWRCKPAEMKRAREIAGAANDREFIFPGGIVTQLAMKLSGNRLSLQALLVDDG